MCVSVYDHLCVGGHLACRLRARLGDLASVSFSLYWFLSLSSELQRCCWPSGVQDASQAHDASPWLALVHSHPSLRWRDRLAEEEESRWRCWTSSLPPTLFFFFSSSLQNKMENKEQRIQKSALYLKGLHENDHTSFVVKSEITCNLYNRHTFHMLKAYRLCVVGWLCGQFVGICSSMEMEGCCGAIWVFQTQ